MLETIIEQELILSAINQFGSYLILGPKGSGKTLLAKHIFLNFICEHGTRCMKCKSCRTFISDNYPDFHFLSGGKVEEVRQLIDKLSIKPYYHKHYVLLDNIDKMTIPAQNTLLKTLEEPPSETLFIMTGTVKNTILSTILSRSFLLSPVLLDSFTILETLKAKYSKEDDVFLEKVSRYANGCLGQAFDMVEKKEFFSMLEEDFNNIKKKNFFSLSNQYAKEYKEETLIILNFIEQFLRDKMTVFIAEKKNIRPIYHVIEKIEIHRTQLKQNINLTMMYQNLILEMQRL